MDKSREKRFGKRKRICVQFRRNLFGNKNLVIAISGTSISKPFSSLITDAPYCYDLLEKTQCLPLYRYDKNDNRIDNISDWGLQQFISHYTDKGTCSLVIEKQDIFHYIYAVLHNPDYRKKYELNLKREFPRIPFYDDFYKWAKQGESLMDLHINYENAEPYPLQTIEFADKKTNPKSRLKADKDSGSILLDENTELRGIPSEAWNYKLGNRSALEWILDQYQEKKPKDPTIAEKFNVYRFADYKEQVIDLLKRVCTVSVETMKIVADMKES